MTEFESNITLNSTEFSSNNNLSSLESLEPSLNTLNTSNTSNSSLIKYGLGNFGSNKISFQQFYLSNNILNYLQNDPLFLSLYNGNEEQLTSIGYCKSIDYPEKPEHIYYEAYFHSLPLNKSFETMHPRYGMIHEKNPASLILTSFYEAIRRKNNNWKLKMIEKLRTFPSIASNLFINILEENRHFAGFIIVLILTFIFFSFIFFYFIFIQ